MKETFHQYARTTNKLYEADITKGDSYYYEYITFASGAKKEFLITKNGFYYERNGSRIDDEKAEATVESSFKSLITFVNASNFPTKNSIKNYNFKKLSDNSLKILYETPEKDGVLTTCSIINQDGLITFHSNTTYLRTETIEAKYDVKLNKKRFY